MKKNIIISMCLLFSISSAKSQVTIGSDAPPLAGALLDLKEIGETTKGLGLPRVELKTLKPELNKLAESIGGVSGTTPWDEDAHIGLVVYNAKTSPPICKNGKLNPYIVMGLYVWDGVRWQSIPPIESDVEDEDVRTIVDHGTNVVAGGNVVGTFTMTYNDGINPPENETYYYAEYGTAGTWMTQSLRTQYSPDGTKLAMTGNQSSNGLDPSGKPQKVVAYPSLTSPSNSADYDANVAAGKQIGLVYSYRPYEL